MLETTSSLINHSCSPNVAIHSPEGYSVDNPTRVIALKTLHPGDEIVCSYIDSSSVYESRQVELKLRWGFTCCCTLCLKSEANTCICPTCIRHHGAIPAKDFEIKHWVDPRAALLCQQEGCTGWTALFRQSCSSVGVCTKCKQPNTLSVKSKDILVKASRFLELRQQSHSVDIDPEVALTAMAPLLYHLSSIQPPCTAEFHRMTKEALEEFNCFRSKYGAKTPEYLLDRFYLMMLYAEGMQLGGEDNIELPGSKVRCVAFNRLAHGYLRDHLDILVGLEKTKGKSRFLSRDLPDVPLTLWDMNAQGRKVLRQAIEEYNIGFGKENGGGVRGRELQEMLDLHEMCSSMMSSNLN